MIVYVLVHQGGMFQTKNVNTMYVSHIEKVPGQQNENECSIGQQTWSFIMVTGQTTVTRKMVGDQNPL